MVSQPISTSASNFSGNPTIRRWILGSERASRVVIGALAYDLYKSHGQLTTSNAIIVAFGFIVSFISAWIVVKSFLGYVQRHGFALFAWWRVIVGTLALIALALGR